EAVGQHIGVAGPPDVREAAQGGERSGNPGRADNVDVVPDNDPLGWIPGGTDVVVHVDAGAAGAEDPGRENGRGRAGGSRPEVVRDGGRLRARGRARGIRVVHRAGLVHAHLVGEGRERRLVEAFVDHEVHVVAGGQVINVGDEAGGGFRPLQG